jgi:hypothetical protein
MRATPTHTFVLTLASLLFLIAPALAEQDSKSVRGRIGVEYHDVWLKVSVFLTNTTDKEITIVTGAGGVPRSIVPAFFSDSGHLGAASWKSYPKRDMKPDLLTLQPGKEIFYDAYIIPRPSGDKIEGVIHFRALDQRDPEYIARLPSQKIPTPTKDGNGETKK